MNFKTYLKILKNGSNILGFQTNFCSTKIKKQFSKNVLKNYFQNLFSKTIATLNQIKLTFENLFQS